MKKVIEEPEWLTLIAPNGCISAKEAAKLFGFKTANVLNDAVSKGNFPKPDFRMGDLKKKDEKTGMRGHNGRPVNSSLWRPETIRAEIARRNAK